MAAVRFTDLKNTEALLAQLPLEIREKALTAGLQKIGRRLTADARRGVRPSSRPPTPGKAKLRPSIATKIRQYRNAVLGVYGPQRTARHAHLVEWGHDIVQRGTKEKAGRTAGLTAKGRRHLRGKGLIQLGKYWVRASGGNKFKVGTHWDGEQVRGGGQVTGRVPPHPYLTPAATALEPQMVTILEEEIRKRVEAFLGG